MLSGICSGIGWLLALYLVLVQPILGVLRYRRLRSLAHGDERARVNWYRRGLLRTWALTGLAFLSVANSGEPLVKLGLRRPDFFSLNMLLFCVVMMALSAWFFARTGKGQRAAARMLDPVAALLPRTAHERWLFMAVALSAGICEEILYRGFLGQMLDVGFPNLPLLYWLGLPALIFGLGHAYQGLFGVLMTGGLGFCFSSVYFNSGSLLFPILLHALIDLRVLAIVMLKPKAAVSTEKRAA